MENPTRKENLITAKEDLAMRYDGTAVAIRKLKDAIESNPGLNASDLMEILQPLAQQYDFDAAHLNQFKNSIDQYESKHKAIRKYRELYPDDGDLFNAFFGRLPKGELEVIEGPLTLHFRCYNVDDYVLAGRGEDEDKIKPEDRAWLEKTAALAINKTRLEDLESGTVTIENVTWNMHVSKPKGREETPEEIEKRAQEYGERSRLHEEQHQFNRLFKPADARKTSTELIDDFNNRNDHSPESTHHLVRNLVKLERVFIEEKLWDEILALYRGGRKRADDLYKNLQGEVYNYRERHKGRIAGIPARTQKELSNATVVTELAEIQKEVDIIFGEEYDADLSKWLNAIIILEAKGYSSDEVISFLLQEPIHNWPKLAERVKDRHN